MRYNNKKKSRPRFKETTGRKAIIAVPEKKQAITAALMEAWLYGAPDSEAAANAGISPQTLKKYLEEIPELKKAKEQLVEKVTLEARKTLFIGIKKNPELALKFLERKLPDEFAPTTKAKITGEVIHEVSEHQIQEALEAMKKGGFVTESN